MSGPKMPDRLVAWIRPDGVLLFPESESRSTYRWHVRLEVVATPGEGIGRHDLYDIAREMARRWNERVAAESEEVAGA